MQAAFNKWFLLPDRTKKKILSTSDGWIIRNLLQFGNSLIPDECILEYGIKKIEKRLTKIVGMKVTVDEKEVIHLGKIYIAEIVGKLN